MLVRFFGFNLAFFGAEAAFRPAFFFGLLATPIGFSTTASVRKSFSPSSPPADAKTAAEIAFSSSSAWSSNRARSLREEARVVVPPPGEKSVPM
jgi:hypothetical protein